MHGRYMPIGPLRAPWERFTVVTAGLRIGNGGTQKRDSKPGLEIGTTVIISSCVASESLSTLDPEALRPSGIPNAEQLQRLVDINERIRNARSTNDRISLNDQWQLELIARCPNRVLLELIHQFMQRTRRYEVALMRETKSVEISTGIHDKIISALRRKKLDAACDLLRENMQSGVSPIINWLRSRPAKV